MAEFSEITRVITEIERGEPNAATQLLPLVYEELRKLAKQKMAREAAGQTLQATALVHEAYLRLIGDNNKSWDNRGHFFAAAAEAMRRILIDNARRVASFDRHGRGASARPSAASAGAEGGRGEEAGGVIERLPLLMIGEIPGGFAGK